MGAGGRGGGGAVMLSFLRRLASLAAAPPPLMLLSPSCCFLALNPLWSRYRCCRCWSAQALQLRLRQLPPQVAPPPLSSEFGRCAGPLPSARAHGLHKHPAGEGEMAVRRVRLPAAMSAASCVIAASATGAQRKSAGGTGTRLEREAQWKPWNCMR